MNQDHVRYGLDAACLDHGVSPSVRDLDRGVTIGMRYALYRLARAV